MSGDSGRSRGRRGIEPLPTQYKAPTPMRRSLDQLASTMGLGSVDGVNELFLRWREIVGDEVGAHCEAVRLEGGCLTVRASDQQWAIELKWMTTLIAERCCAALGPHAVTEVKIIR